MFAFKLYVPHLHPRERDAFICSQRRHDGNSDFLPLNSLDDARALSDSYDKEKLSDGTNAHPTTGQNPDASPSSAPEGAYLPAIDSEAWVRLTKCDGIQLTPTMQLPRSLVAGQPISYSETNQPLYLGSAITTNSLQPCFVDPSQDPPASWYPLGSERIAHYGRYILFPFNPDTMQWADRQLVGSWCGELQSPDHLRPIITGYDSEGGELYHALGEMEGSRPSIGWATKKQVRTSIGITDAQS